jgi:hypothetical protein
VIDKFKQYKNVIIIVAGSVAAILAIVGTAIDDIETEIVKIDSVVKTMKVDSLQYDTLTNEEAKGH